MDESRRDTRTLGFGLMMGCVIFGAGLLAGKTLTAAAPAPPPQVVMMPQIGGGIDSSPAIMAVRPAPLKSIYREGLAAKMLATPNDDRTGYPEIGIYVSTDDICRGVYQP